jgi:hypothetical protein
MWNYVNLLTDLCIVSDEKGMPSSKIEIVFLVGLKGSRFGEGVWPVACGNGAIDFNTWDQSGVRFASCTGGHHPRLKINHMKELQYVIGVYSCACYVAWSRTCINSTHPVK